VRTTLNIDEDVLHAVRERARRENRSAGEVLSELARQALTEGIPEQRTSGAHGFDPLPPRGTVVSNALIDRLREDEPE
jgi:hypothetical protein